MYNARESMADDDESFNLKKFDPSTIGDGAVVLMVGGRGTGKSTVLDDFLWYKRYISDGIGMSGTEESNEGLSRRIPDSYIYNDFQPEVLKQAVDRARRINKMRTRLGLPKKYTFIVIDDCGCDSTFTRDPTVKRILMNGRHFT